MLKKSLILASSLAILLNQTWALDPLNPKDCKSSNYFYGYAKIIKKNDNLLSFAVIASANCTPKNTTFCEAATNSKGLINLTGKMRKLSDDLLQLDRKFFLSACGSSHDTPVMEVKIQPNAGDDWAYIQSEDEKTCLTSKDDLCVKGKERSCECNIF